VSPLHQPSKISSTDILGRGTAETAVCGFTRILCPKPETARGQPKSAHRWLLPKVGTSAAVPFSGSTKVSLSLPPTKNPTKAYFTHSGIAYQILQNSTFQRKTPHLSLTNILYAGFANL
jgi:hypothetical protein